MGIHKLNDNVTLFYQIIDDYSLDIYKVECLGKQIIRIPDEIDGHTITGIFPEAFLSSDVKKIILPETINYIGHGAFKDCKYLEEINIPDAVENIECAAFEGCDNLASVVLPKNVVFDSGLFANCTNLKKQ